MPKKNYKVKTTFEADGNLSKRVGKMSKSMGRMARMADRVKRALKAAGRAAAVMGRAVGRMAKVGLLAGAAAITGVWLATTKLVDSMDNLAKKTRAMDFPIEEFQEFQFAFQQAGVDAPVFEKSLAKFTKTLGEAKGGYGAMYTALKKTNPQLLKQLNATDDTAKAFELYIGAIRETSGATNKAALSSAAFGRAGLDMVNGANLSAEALAGLRMEMRENGVVTAEQAAKAEEFNDMMNRVKLTLAGVARDVLAPMLPQMTKFADKLRTWIVANKGLIQQKIQAFFKAVWENAKKIYFWVKKNIPAIKEFFGEVKSLAGALASAAKFVWENRKAFAALAISIVAVKVAVAGLKMATVGAGMAAAAGSATAASTALTGVGSAMAKVGVAAAAFGAGWAIGEALNKNLIDPLVEATSRANYELEKLTTNVENNMRRMSTARLEASKTEIRQAAKESGGVASSIGRFFGGENAFGGAATDIAGRAKLLGDIDTEIASRPPGADGPQVQSSSTSTTETKNVTLTIKNDSGNKLQTDGADFDGFDLVTTGGF